MDVKKIAIVAGGAGFIGSHLCDYLLLDPERVVYCLDNLSTGSVKNIAHLRSLDRFKFDHYEITHWWPPFDDEGKEIEIYNLACAASPKAYMADPLETLDTCFNGTRNLLEIAEICKAKFLQASTSEVYGDPTVSPQSEDYHGNVNTFGPRACYDEGKRVAETLCYEYWKKGVDVKVARIFNTYGPRMQADDGRVVSNFIVQALKREPLTIYGDGKQTRSLCYVSDMVEGLVKFQREGLHRIVNLGTEDEMTVNDIASLIENAIWETPLPREYKDLPQDDPKQRRPLTTLARAGLSWNPTVTIHSGVKKTIEYFTEKLRSGAPE